MSISNKTTWGKKRTTKKKKKRGNMIITTGFPHLHRPRHLQAPHDHLFDEIHLCDPFYAFCACFHYQIQENIHAAKGRVKKTS